MPTHLTHPLGTLKKTPRRCCDQAVDTRIAALWNTSHSIAEIAWMEKVTSPAILKRLKRIKREQQKEEQ